MSTEQQDTRETWLSVVGHTLYEVSDNGRVRSVRTGKILSPSYLRGYTQVCFSENKVRTTVKVHRLVALAFLGSPKPGDEVCHHNGVRDDNRAVNLRWGSRSENVRDSIGHGTHSEVRKSSCPRGHALVLPNLSKHCLERKRICLACTYARKQMSTKADGFKELSDTYFIKIMGAAA